MKSTRKEEAEWREVHREINLQIIIDQESCDLILSFYLIHGCITEADIEEDTLSDDPGLSGKRKRKSKGTSRKKSSGGRCM